MVALGDIAASIHDDDYVIAPLNDDVTTSDETINYLREIDVDGREILVYNVDDVSDLVTSQPTYIYCPPHSSPSAMTSWRQTIYILILVICFLISTGAIIFAIQNRLCGHCVLWWKDSRELRHRMTSSMREVYKRVAAKTKHLSSSPGAKRGTAVVDQPEVERHPMVAV